MRIVELEQATDEWKKWRNAGIGSSDIATIMGVSPYQTPYALWEEKCGVRLSFTGNSFTTHGILNEPHARDWLNANLQLKLKPICVEDHDNPIFKASLDGFDAEKGCIYEIKCPYSTEKIFFLRESQEIPEIWRLQILWAMAITDVRKAYMAVWDFNTCECFCIECKRDPEMEAQMFEEAEKFWKLVKTFNPPELGVGDYVEIEDKKLKDLLLSYSKFDAVEKGASKEKKSLKEKIIDFGDDGNFSAYGFKICRTSPRKSYDLKAMEQEGIDIEKYLKPSSIGSYRILLPKY